MPAINLQRTRRFLEAFNWSDLFIQELGWNNPAASAPIRTLTEGSETFTCTPVAELGGALVYKVEGSTGQVPDQKTRLELHKTLVSSQREHLLLFQDAASQQALWSWPRYENGRLQPRTHLYVKGQPGDLFLSKLANMYFELDELDDDGQTDLLTVTERLKKALDVSPVTRKFYDVFSKQQHEVVKAIKNLPDEAQRRHYASVLLTRLMFVYFLQQKGLLDGGNLNYLDNKLQAHQAWAATQSDPAPTFYTRFLRPLFFQGFALSPEHRDPTAASLLGTIPYLNGGLFLPHGIENANPDLDVPDEAIAQLLSVFTRFSWNLDDRAGAQDDEINPDVLGYILEKYINSSTSKQKDAGAFYTPAEITTYLCDQTIDALLLHACNDPEGQPAIPGVRSYRFSSLNDLLIGLDDRLAKKLLCDVLPKLSILDPACGSGAFLVAALKKLETVYQAVVGFVDVKAVDTWLKDWLREARRHPSITYFIRKEIITRNIYGVDLMDEAIEIARLRLFLALVAAARTPAELEPLPNIDFNLMEGNGLVGLMHIQEADFDRYSQGNVLAAGNWAHYQTLLDEKNNLIDEYKGIGLAGHAPDDTEIAPLRADIDRRLAAARQTLNQVLHTQLQTARVAHQQAHWDAGKGKETYTKHPLTEQHIAELRPFHWGYEFSRVLERGGFDIIIANPPWEIFKPNAKEFFAEYSDVVQKNAMRLEDFEEKKAELLTADPELRTAWENYCSRFPYVSKLFKESPDYPHQTSTVAGKKTSSDLNLYKLFLERCFHLLRPDGECGIVVPSGIYTDLGTKGLREMLFGRTAISGLFGFENRRGIFEDVDSRFKFVVMSFVKGKVTQRFPATFMRLNVEELAQFPRQGAIWLDADMVRRLSPESYSLMEFKDIIDQQIAEKIAVFPAIGGSSLGNWGIKFTREFDMTNDSRGLFLTAPSVGCVPLFEGKMMHQFKHQFAAPRYWVEPITARQRVLGQRTDNGQQLDYQYYRLAFRDIARNTDERTMIATILPPDIFCGNTLPTLVTHDNGNRIVSNELQLFLVGVFNSFVFDKIIRFKVTAHCNFFHVYSQPIPQLPPEHPSYRTIVRLAAQLICTTPEFDALAQSAGLAGHQEGVTDAAARAELRAELDAQVAHLYGLTEVEFKHVLQGFPLVKEQVKEATLAAFQALIPNPDEATLTALIAHGEGRHLEFKRGAYHDPRNGQRNGEMLTTIVTAVAAFLNSYDGGTVLVGVADKPVEIIGLADDLATGGYTRQADPEDAYKLALCTALADRIGQGFVDCWDLHFLTVQGVRLCRIVVRPGRGPAYLNGDLYVRGPVGKHKLPAQEAVEYIRHRFPAAP